MGLDLPSSGFVKRGMKRLLLALLLPVMRAAVGIVRKSCWPTLSVAGARAIAAGIICLAFLCFAAQFRHGSALPLEVVEFSSTDSGNIFPADSGTLAIRLKRAPGVRYSLVVSNEAGGVIASRPIDSAALSVPLPQRGWYSVEVQAVWPDGVQSDARTSAAVIGKSLPWSQRANSPFGVWHVHGDLRLAAVANSKWTRQIWNLLAYRRDDTGRVVPMPLTRRPTDNFNLFGALAYGLPNWLRAGKGADDSISVPRNWQDFDKVVRQFARDIKPFPKYFEVYNEPETKWRGSDADLVAFLDHIAIQIKAMHPDTMVLGPTLASIDMDRFKRLVALGLLNHLDGVAMHAYVNGTPPEGEFLTRVTDLVDYVRSLKKPAHLPIYITEFGWTSAAGTWQRPVSELVQAQYLSRSLTLLRQLDAQGILYFCLYFRQPENPGAEGFSIIHADGTPKPAYAAYANTVRWLTSARGAGRSINLGPLARLSLFDSQDASIAVAWSTNPASLVYLPANLGYAEDMMGRPFNGQLITGSQSPVFIRAKESLFAARADAPREVSAGQQFALSGEGVSAPQPLVHESGTLLVPTGTKPGTYVVTFYVVGLQHILPVIVQ